MYAPSEPRTFDEWLLKHDLELVYYPRGSSAHLVRLGEANCAFGLGPLCRRVPRWREPFGTGAQDEYERARSLPLCSRCATYLDEAGTRLYPHG